VHVLGLEFEQLGERFRHGLKAATEVEPHCRPVMEAPETRYVAVGDADVGIRSLATASSIFSIAMASGATSSIVGKYRGWPTI
jgi:hypothetical protein